MSARLRVRPSGAPGSLSLPPPWERGRVGDGVLKSLLQCAVVKLIVLSIKRVFTMREKESCSIFSNVDQTINVRYFPTIRST